MEEKTLRKLAFLCSVLGIVVLFFITTQIEVAATDIGEITRDDMGRGVKACGEISSIRVSKNHIFMDLEDSSGSIRVVIFNSTALSLKEAGKNLYDLKEGDGLCVFGVVDEYPKGSGILEIIYRKGLIERF